MASDPNLQVLGAAYIQHKCYSDPAAKKQVTDRLPPLLYWWPTGPRIPLLTTRIDPPPLTDPQSPTTSR